MPPADSSKAPDRSNPPPGQGAQVDPEDEDKALLSQLTIGSVVDGKYRVDRVLGRGAMGVVVQATHEQLGERVALKFLRYRAKTGTEDFQQRFKREAKVSAMLKNEHITRVIDVGLWQGRVPYMVMDYLNGTDLREVMKSTGQLQVGTAIDYTVQICVGIAEAHAAGIVHRDLKPSNLFVTKRPDGSDLVKILDFGISKWRAGESDLDELTQTGVVLGSPKYMAPEQLFGSADVDARADVWSIGAILYEMLAGKPPFDLPTFTRICAELSTNNPPPPLGIRCEDVTPELEAVVMKCFERDPNKRTPDVSELAGSLLDAVDAPFAAPMRQKIAAILDPTSSPLSSSGARSMQSGTYGAMPTSGKYAAAMSATGSGRSVVAVPGATGPASTGAPHLVETEPPRRGSTTPWLVGAGLVAAAAVAYFALIGKDHPPAAVQTPPSATVVTAPPLPPVPTVTASAAPSSSVAAPTASTAPSAIATAQPPPLPARPGWRPPPPRPPPPSPGTAVAAQTAAPPAPSPSPPPTPTATSKTDPLGDRQ